MPTTKSRLSKLEQQKYVADLEELRSEGADIDIPYGWLDDARALEIRVVSDGSTAVEGPAGSVFYTVRLRLTARRPRVILLDVELETDWDQDIVLESLRRDKPLGRPKLFQRRKPIYRIGHEKYAADDLLNDGLANSLHFSYCGDTIEGVLVFSGLKAIPKRYHIGMSVPFRLTLLDQFERQIHCESHLVVIREAKRKIGDAAKPVRSRTRRGSRSESTLWS